MAQLYFHYSAMNAGKSTSLLQSAHNYREQGMAVAIHTAAIDDRYGHGVVRSRIGLASEASLFDARTDFLADTRRRTAELATRDIDRLACVFVDEAQFLSVAHVDQLARAVDELGVPVLCYGLRTDFRGELFPGSARLLAVADKLVELKTVCRCGRKATMTVRLDVDHRVVAAGAQVEIGGNERYESMCRRHYRESMAAVEPS